MKNFVIYRILFLFLCLAIPGNLHSWGFFGHKKINRHAVFTLPPEMIGFYKRHIEYITEHAVDPDRRRYAVTDEAARHYIDMDHYGDHPFDSVPKYWKNAVAKFSEDTLKAYGIVPWHVERMLFRLTEAFKEMDAEKIITTSADFGHYVADAHVPLHTTENYNGQLTGQIGIHGFWESRLPELFADDFDFLTGRAVYIEKPNDFIWKVIKESFSEKDSVLQFEANLNDIFPTDRKFSFENRGQTTIRVYSDEYSKKYHELLDGMVERRMRAAVLAVGSFWYTAWVNAGQPDMKLLYDKELTEQFKEKQKEQEEWWQKGGLNVREHAD